MINKILGGASLLASEEACCCCCNCDGKSEEYKIGNVDGHAFIVIQVTEELT